MKPTLPVILVVIGEKGNFDTVIHITPPTTCCCCTSHSTLSGTWLYESFNLLIIVAGHDDKLKTCFIFESVKQLKEYLKVQNLKGWDNNQQGINPAYILT